LVATLIKRDIIKLEAPILDQDLINNLQEF
jgi:hypothetical protein